MGTRGIALLAIKYLPAVTAFFMWGHIALHLFFGIHWYVAENVCGVTLSMAIAFLLVSHAFKYCWLHKAFIVYACFANALVSANRHFDMTYLKEHEIVAVATGIVLFSLLAFRFNSFKKCNPTIPAFSC